MGIGRIEFKHSINLEDWRMTQSSDEEGIFWGRFYKAIAMVDHPITVKRPGGYDISSRLERSIGQTSELHVSHDGTGILRRRMNDSVLSEHIIDDENGLHFDLFKFNSGSDAGKVTGVTFWRPDEDTTYLYDVIRSCFNSSQRSEIDRETLIAQCVFVGCPSVEKAKNFLSGMVKEGDLSMRNDKGTFYYQLG